MFPTRFSGTDRYVATDDLMMAVNAAVTLGRPLLVKGEPGTGKTNSVRHTYWIDKMMSRCSSVIG